jgi:HD-like signal output (HDOD) protein
MAEHNVIKLIKASGYLPEIPREYGEIIKMLQSPDEYDMDQCVHHFSRFPQLGDALLQVLNHKFNIRHPKTTVKDALNYLGARKAKTIAISYAIRLLVPDSKGRAKFFNSKTYWKHCIGTAAAAYLIAQENGLSDKDKLFTFGLIHDIGITVLDICLPDYLDKIDALHQKGGHQIVAEKIVLGGLTHAEIGLWICQEWGLPEEIAAVVGFHHTPYRAEKYADEVKIMHLADSISTNYYEKLLGNSSTFIYADKLMDELKIDKDFVESIIVKLPSEVDTLKQILYV